MFLIADGAAKATGDELAEYLGDRPVARWDDVAQHVPVELAERARGAATASGADVLVCVGGGSSTGLAKAIALTQRLPIVAVPTTYAGSEQTTIYGLTGGRHKQTGRDPVVLPKAVIYDPELTVGLPSAVTGPSSFNALAHAVEALYASGHNPVTSALALEGVRAIRRSLPLVMDQPDDLDARSRLLYGAYCRAWRSVPPRPACTTSSATSSVARSTSSTPTPTACCSPTPSPSTRRLPEEMSRLAGALDASDGDAAGALWDLAVESHVPTSLADLGLGRDELTEAAERAAVEITDNPRPCSAADLLALLQRAFAGGRPDHQQRQGGAPR